MNYKRTKIIIIKIVIGQANPRKYVSPKKTKNYINFRNSYSAHYNK
jgi:hypothetical protein